MFLPVCKRLNLMEDTYSFTTSLTYISAFFGCFTAAVAAKSSGYRAIIVSSETGSITTPSYIIFESTGDLVLEPCNIFCDDILSETFIPSALGILLREKILYQAAK